MSKSRDNFVRLAEKRTTKILKDIDLLANLSNRSNYSYNHQDINKIFQVITKRLKLAQSRFDAGLSASEDQDFKL